MYTHKQLKTLYLLLLALYPSYNYSMNLPLEKEKEDVTFAIQGYPSDLQCTIFESMLSHLNSYQTTFFEDNQIQDKEEIEQIGVLRYQIACLVIKNLLMNSIDPKKIPHSMAAIKDILYRGLLFIPYSKMVKMDGSELLKNTLNYQPVTGTINKNIQIPGVISDVFLNNIKTLFMQNRNEKFCYPGRPSLLTILKKEWKKQPQENTPLLSDHIRKYSNQIPIEPTNSSLVIAMFTIAGILSGSLIGLIELIIELASDS